jgi:hypothetical protein
MKVTQADSRSISIVSDTGVRISIPYAIFWNGHDRPAESIVLTSPAQEDGNDRRSGTVHRKSAGPHEVCAYFLFGEIRDQIIDDDAGIMLSRRWSVKTPGSVHLSIRVEFDSPADLAYLFPGLHAARGLPSTAVSFFGEKTTYPSSVLLSLGRRGAIIFSPSAVCGGAAGSIGVSRNEIEDEPARLRVEMRFPGIEEPTERIGPKPADLLPAEQVLIESPGSLERSHILCLAFTSREEIAIHGGAAVLRRGDTRFRAPPVQCEVDSSALATAVQGVLKSHSYQNGGIAGLKEFPDSPWISASAGLGCALALRKFFPEDARLGEHALKLADFSLKGQLPGGLFYESFHLPTKRWCGLRGQADSAFLSVGQSARVAELLLELSDELAEEGQPHEKYFLAGLRFVDFFLDGKRKLIAPGGLCSFSSVNNDADCPPGLAGLEIFFPLSRVFARTGHDRYRKALDVLVRRFSSLNWDLFQPPASREGRGSDAAGALLAARLYVQMRALGYKPVEPPVSSAAAARARAADSARLFASLLVPWIRMNGRPFEKESPFPFSGYLLDSFARRRLLCAGHETALLLLQLRKLSQGEAEKLLLVTLANVCLASAKCTPIGTAFIQHTRWDSQGFVAGDPGKKSSHGKNGFSANQATSERKLGPVDSRRVATEVIAGIQLVEEFPVSST